MFRVTKAVSALAVVVGLGIAVIALTPAKAVAGCRYEKTDYTGPGTPQNCLGGTCSAGWCCQICGPKI